MKQRIIFTVLMSLVLSSFMTFWVTWINLGFSDAFIAQWLHAFQLAWPAAAIISFISVPYVQILTSRIHSYLE